MRFLVVGDLQLHCEDQTADRTRQSVETLQWILGLLQEHRPDAFVHLGDFGESVHGVDHHTLALMTWFVANVGNQVGPNNCWWLVGNHDFYTRDGEVNLMRSLSHLMPGHNVPFPWVQGPEHTLFVSWLPPGHKDRLRAEFGLLYGKGEKFVMFTHLPVQGAMYRPGHYEQNGVDPNWLPRVTFCGHYHTPNPPEPAQAAFGHAVWFCGSPMSHDFRDNCYGLSAAQQLRGVWLVDVNYGQLISPPIFIPNPHARYFVSFTSDVDAAGNPTDVWYNQHCILPRERTTFRVAVPKGKEGTVSVDAGKVLVRTHVPEQNMEVSTTISPNASPQQAVRDYLQAVGDDKLGGLDRAALENDGVQLVSGTFQTPKA